MGQGDALGGSRRQCHLRDPVKELKDPPERRFLGGLFRLAGNAFPGLDKGSAEVFFCQVVDEKSQHHQKHEPFDALLLLQVLFGGPKGRILEKSGLLVPPLPVPCTDQVVAQEKGLCPDRQE